MTYPQSDQSLPAEDALPVSATKASTEGASEALRRSRDSSQKHRRLRTAGKLETHTTASLSAAHMERQSNHQSHPPYPLLSPSSAARRSSSAVLPPRTASHTFAKINLLGVEFDNVSKLELLSKLTRGVIFTPNVDHLMKLRRDRDFALVYRTADYKVCDSQILIFVAKFLGKPLKAKLSGSDLFPWFCDYHRDNNQIKIFLLGGAEGVAREAQRRINARIGRQIVVGEYSPSYGFEQNPEECEKILSMLEQSPANVVAVCLGAPKQEKWTATYRDCLPGIDIFMAIGATVDFEAGMKPRSPRFVSDIGLEWLYRLLCEPRRLWKRYLLDGLPFLGLVLAEKLRQLRWLR